MDNFDFAAQPELPRDRIWVSWSEQWDIGRYAESYLRERKLAVDEAAKAEVLRHISRITAKGALRKADVDYYLDVNAKPSLQASPVQLARKLRK